MTELDLYKFCEDMEMDWRGEKLILWIYHWNIEDFVNMVGEHYFSEGGMDVVLLAHGQIGMELNDLCEYFGIEPERIHPKEEGSS